jgi:hypothetical protein
MIGLLGSTIVAEILPFYSSWRGIKCKRMVPLMIYSLSLNLSPICFSIIIILWFKLFSYCTRGIGAIGTQCGYQLTVFSKREKVDDRK